MQDKEIELYDQCYQCLHWHNGEMIASDPTQKRWRLCSNNCAIKHDTRACKKFILNTKINKFRRRK
jgi:hypothetical protein